MFNVVTRTSGRPNGFARARESILAQGHKVRHIVTVDDGSDYAVGDVILRVKPQDAEFPPNLYIAEALGYVEDGWVVILDDDDEYLRPDAFEIIESHIVDEDSLILWKVFLFDREIPTYNFGLSPVRGDIDGNGFAFHSKYKDMAHYAERFSGDFDAVEKLYRYLNPVWVDAVLVGSQREHGLPGYGRREDTAPSGAFLVQKNEGREHGTNHLRGTPANEVGSPAV